MTKDVAQLRFRINSLATLIDISEIIIIKYGINRRTIRKMKIEKRCLEYIDLDLSKKRITSKLIKEFGITEKYVSRVLESIDKM